MGVKEAFRPLCVRCNAVDKETMFCCTEVIERSCRRPPSPSQSHGLRQHVPELGSGTRQHRVSPTNTGSDFHDQFYLLTKKPHPILHNRGSQGAFAVVCAWSLIVNSCDRWLLGLCGGVGESMKGSRSSEKVVCLCNTYRNLRCC
jgi:hypothetical protein